MIPIGEKVTGTNNTVALLPTLIIEENAKFQEEISKTTYAFFSCLPLNCIHELKVKNS